MFKLIFDFSVDLLEISAQMLGTTYVDINVWLFVILWPLLTILLLVIIIYQRGIIKGKKLFNITQG